MYCCQGIHSLPRINRRFCEEMVDMSSAAENSNSGFPSLHMVGCISNMQIHWIFFVFSFHLEFSFDFIAIAKTSFEFYESGVY